MILLIDNFDSFVFNLARYVTELGKETCVIRNDKLKLEEIAELCPSHLIISPGPCTPNEAGITLEAIQTFQGKIPILGVCLGHQAIAQALGGKVIRAKTPMHGKADKIFHQGNGLFSGLPNPLTVARYHSLIVDNHSLPVELKVTAYSAQNEIMAFSHVKYPLYGVQFHPESILTQQGYALLRWFLER